MCCILHKDLQCSRTWWWRGWLPALKTHQ